jgi:hypothetical protein
MAGGGFMRFLTSSALLIFLVAFAGCLFAAQSTQASTNGQTTFQAPRPNAYAAQKLANTIVSQNIVPQNTAQQNTAQQNTAQQNIAQQNIAPQNIAPQNIAPQNTAPQKRDSMELFQRRDFDKGIYAPTYADGKSMCAAIMSYNFTPGDNPELKSITTCTPARPNSVYRTEDENRKRPQAPSLLMISSPQSAPRAKESSAR